ncbi:MAG: hypothetical protein LUD12_02860 [Lachnospiraceae bacterium]|nr:hypothetical protein [Lachnospiraceae bacterium]
MQAKTLRYYAVAVTGVLTFFAAAAAQWAWTQRPIEDVAFIALMTAAVGTSAFLVVTEPKRKQPRRKHRAQQWSGSEDSFKIITLDRGEWER